MTARNRMEGPKAAPTISDRAEAGRDATHGMSEHGVDQARNGLSNTKMNTMSSSPADQIRNAMNDPKARAAINQALADHGAASFQNRTDWAGTNPELARQVLAAAGGISSHPSGGINRVGNSLNAHGAHVDARQTGSHAYGQGASNSAGQIGG